MYYNLTSIHTVLRAAPFGEELAAAFNQFVGAEGRGARGRGLGHCWRGRRLVQVARACAHRLRVAWQYLFLRAASKGSSGGRRFARAPSRPAAPTSAARGAARLPRGFLASAATSGTNASLADAGSMVCYGRAQGLLRARSRRGTGGAAQFAAEGAAGAGERHARDRAVEAVARDPGRPALGAPLHHGGGGRCDRCGQDAAAVRRVRAGIRALISPTGASAAPPS